MNKFISACENKALQLHNSLSARKFRKGDGGVFTLVVGAAIGTLVLIGFYLVAKEGLSTWGDSFKSLVTL